MSSTDQGCALSPSGEQVDLVLGEQSAVVVEVGGGLRTYAAGGLELLDGYAIDEMRVSGRGQVMAPWPNRLEDGRYSFDGHDLELPLDEPAAHNAIHGLVRWSSWTVVGREPHRAVLEHLLRPRPGYPFTLELLVEYTLLTEGLTVRTTATNRGDAACPYGAGAHPYIRLGRDVVDPLVLRVPAATVLRSDARGLPTATEPVAGTELDFRTPRAIGGTTIDNAFTDLERDENGLARVELTAPGGECVTVWADESYPWLMIFTGDPLPDVNRRSLAVEPMTCPPNAFRTGEALIRLDPGENHVGRWGISPSGLGA
jgi:aldose 1-epimerase